MPFAIRMHQAGGPEVMSWEEVEVGDPAPTEARVRHAAVGLNYIDIYHRTGLYPLPLPSGLGLEAAGVVEAIGTAVTDLRPGDRVAYAGGPVGAYSQVRGLPADRLLKLPDAIDFRTAAAMMLQGLTSAYLLRRTCRVVAGDAVLIHAAAGGVGLIACQWAKALGATVIGTATSESGAAAIGERLKPLGGHGRVLQVNEAGSIEALIDAIQKEFGGLSILVNNAGITRDNLLMRMKDEDWQAILDTNLTSVYRASKAVMRGMMKARRGRIVNIASVIGVTGNAGQANYAAAKAGIIAFSKSLAKEIGSRNVTVNVVAPGFIDTDMTRDLPEDAKNAMLGQIALGRLGEPADIARAVAFLAGPDAGYITGETLHVNGGMYMA